MSTELDKIAIETFISDAHSEFQAQGFLLDNTITVKSGTKGSVTNFPVFGKGIAYQKSPGDEVTSMGIGNRNVEVLPQDFNVSITDTH